MGKPIHYFRIQLLAIAILLPQAIFEHRAVCHASQFSGDRQQQRWPVAGDGSMIWADACSGVAIGVAANTNIAVIELTVLDDAAADCIPALCHALESAFRLELLPWIDALTRGG